MCKRTITPLKAHGETEPAPRLCQKPIWRDGWCHMHHPLRAEEDRATEIRIAENKVRRQEESSVGLHLRRNHPELFEKIAAEVREIDRVRREQFSG